MIDPKLLTPDNGFVEGGVVDIVDNHGRRFVGRLSHVTEFNIWLVESNFHGFMFSEVESIRPLTGPMAIWNFAPEWANYHLTRHDMKVSAFRVELVDYMRHGPHAEEYKNDWTARPFWANRKPQ